MNKKQKSFHSLHFPKKILTHWINWRLEFPIYFISLDRTCDFFSDKTYLRIRANKTQLLLSLMFFGVPWLEKRELHLKVFRCQPKLYSRELGESRAATAQSHSNIE